MFSLSIYIHIELKDSNQRRNVNLEEEDIFFFDYFA